MLGPFILDNNTVTRILTRVSAGAYVLSTDGRNASYVGRSDSDLAGRLKSWIGQGYSHFWAEYASSPKAAFDLECAWGHAYIALNNLIHPARPQNSGWQCVSCNIFQNRP